MAYATPGHPKVSLNNPSIASPTAAQEALSSVERLVGNLREVKSRVSRIADNLGVNIETDGGEKTVRPVRSGIIGSITDATDSAYDVLNSLSDLVSNIERQV